MVVLAVIDGLSMKNAKSARRLSLECREWLLLACLAEPHGQRLFRRRRNKYAVIENVPATSLATSPVAATEHARRAIEQEQWEAI
jgi:hypothetical protein